MALRCPSGRRKDIEAGRAWDLSREGGGDSGEYGLSGIYRGEEDRTRLLLGILHYLWDRLSHNLWLFYMLALLTFCLPASV